MFKENKHGRARRTWRSRFSVLVVFGLTLGLALAFASASLADAGHGDCKNDNTGQHNGYECSAPAGGGEQDNGKDEGKKDDAGDEDGHGDCNNDNAGKHNGYECSAPAGGGSSTATVASSTVVAPVAVEAPQQAILGERLRACASRRSFAIHIRRYHGVHYRSVRITFNGRVLAARQGNRRVVAPIVLKGLPRGTFTIRIRAVTTKGRVMNGKRIYHTCVAKRPTHAPPRL